MVPRKISQTGPTPQSVSVVINGSELSGFVKRANTPLFFQVTKNGHFLHQYPAENKGLAGRLHVASLGNSARKIQYVNSWVCGKIKRRSRLFAIAPKRPSVV